MGTRTEHLSLKKSIYSVGKSQGETKVPTPVGLLRGGGARGNERAWKSGRGHGHGQEVRSHRGHIYLI